MYQSNRDSSAYTLWRLEAVEEEMIARRDYREPKAQTDLVEEAATQQLAVYPNPVRDRLSVSGAEALSGRGSYPKLGRQANDVSRTERTSVGGDGCVCSTGGAVYSRSTTAR